MHVIIISIIICHHVISCWFYLQTLKRGGVTNKVKNGGKGALTQTLKYISEIWTSSQKMSEVVLSTILNGCFNW